MAPVLLSGLVGRGEEWLLAYFFNREDRRRARVLYRRHHEKILIRYCRPLFFADEILQQAKRRGWLCGVVSNRPQEQVSAVVQSFGWDDRLAAVIGARDGRPLKPDPSMIHEAIGRMTAAPEAAVLIGDTDIDAAAAAAAGIPFMGVATGASTPAALNAAGAVRVFQDLRSCWGWLSKQPHGAKGVVHA